ncbi:MAG: flagellar hook-length control protein FliK [Polaromonas sp.]|nr:flagellar hook-length control protein FliK [Polaromonas sp.]
MSLILPSTAAPAPAANPGTNATTRYDEQGQNNSGSFGEALARSLAPAGEKADQPAAKAATAQPARRQAAPPKTDAEDLANAMALSLVPIETRMVQAALPTGTGTAAGSITPGTSAASLNDLLARMPALANGADGAAAAPEVAADADAQSQLASVLAAASLKSADPNPLQAGLVPVSDGASIQMDPLAMATQASAAGTGFSDPSSRREDKAAPKPSVLSDARADLTPAAPHGAPKVAASSTVTSTETSTETAGPTITGGQVAADTTVSTSTALPTTPVTAAVNVSGGVTAPNGPIPVATASLMPGVGSPEWGKALGQHVIQMGNAGHQVAELQLNPPGLGPLKVTLSMSDHQMQAMFVSAHASVRAAVEAALPQLRTTLADNGISLGNTSVGAESQQQTAFADNPNSQPERGAYRPSAGTEPAALLPSRSATEPVRRSNGLSIDTYA